MTVVVLSFHRIEVDFYFEIDQIFGRYVRFATPYLGFFYSNLRMTFMKLAKSVLCSADSEC
jgi:hypothetical protein